MPENQHAAFSPEREAFRSRYNVRIVTPKEEGFPILDLPECVYGFTTAPATEAMPLFIKPVYQCTEVLKIAGGEVILVGYVTRKDAELLEQGADPASIDLFPEPYGEAVNLVAVPQSRVERTKPPTRDHGNAMKLELSPV